MAESFSIRAVLSAADRGFSSAMKNAQSSISNLKSVVYRRPWFWSAGRDWTKRVFGHCRKCKKPWE